MTGWYTSAMNYDMISQNPCDTMNLHMNQLWDHSIAMRGIYDVPLYSFNNFQQYGNIAGNAYLTDPQYTLRQMTWGTPAWSNTPWGNTPWGMQWNGGTTGGGSSSTTSAEDEKFKTKYNKLLTLVKQLMNYEYLNDDEKSELTVASKSSKGTWEEKFERLKEAYDKVDKETVKDFLVNDAKKVGVSSDIKGKEDNDDSFYNRLADVGYEMNSKTVDGAAEEFFDNIKTLKSNNGSATTAEGVIARLGTTINVLDFVSSWNSNYRNETDSERIIDHIGKYWSEVEDESLKNTVYSHILKPLVRAMVTEAKEVRKSLDEDSQEAITDAIDALESSLANSSTSIDSELSRAFDNLYLLTRNGATAKLRNDAISYYGEIDNEVFNEELFEKDTISDLKEEGFTNEEIENASVKVGEKETRRTRRRDNNDDEPKVEKIDQKTVTEQVAELKKDTIEELTIKKDGKTVVYQEKTMTGDSDGDGKADYAKLYYVNEEGKLVEWNNTKVQGGKFVPVKAGVAQGETEVKASEIKDAKKKATAKKKDELAGEDARTNGRTLASDLAFGFTDSYVYTKIDKNLSKLNKNNIVEFLDGYYSDAGKIGATEGLIEKLDDEYDGGTITMTNKKKIINSLLDVAKEEGLSNSTHYVALKDLMQAYTSDKDRKDSNTFNHGGWSRLFQGEFSWGVLAAYGPLGLLFDKVTDNEVIDKHLEALYKEIKAKQGA